MKNKPNAETVWKQLEDVLIPRLRLSLIERAVYYHLLRHSRLEGKPSYRFSIASLGRGTHISREPVRDAVRRLVDQGALRLIQRNKQGHVVEVRVPEEIRATRFAAARVGHRPPDAAPIEGIDFMQTKALRQAIHSRERGKCFYCLRRLASTLRCLDHVVPRAVGTQFLPQLGFRLCRLQFPKRGDARRGFPPLALPRTPPDRLRTHRPRPRPRCPGPGQAPPRGSSREVAEPRPNVPTFERFDVPTFRRSNVSPPLSAWLWQLRASALSVVFLRYFVTLPCC
jgi:hypothetical protein